MAYATYARPWRHVLPVRDGRLHYVYNFSVSGQLVTCRVRPRREDIYRVRYLQDRNRPTVTRQADLSSADEELSAPDQCADPHPERWAGRLSALAARRFAKTSHYQRRSRSPAVPSPRSPVDVSGRPFEDVGIRGHFFA